jgi:hypothetical protein
VVRFILTFSASSSVVALLIPIDFSELAGRCLFAGSDRQTVAPEVVQHHRDVRVPDRDLQGDLHDQRHRVREQRNSQIHQELQAIHERRISVEAGLLGDP